MSSPDESVIDVFDFIGSDEDEDETLGWAVVNIGEFELRLPQNKVHIWDSSLMLAEWICENKEHVAGKTVVELGGGLGLPAFAAALCGAARVVATDLSPKAMVELNTAANFNTDVYPQLSVLSGTVLDWFDCDNSTLGKFDCILAADVNYERALTEPLTKTVLGHLSTDPGAPLYLASRLGRVSLSESLESLSGHLGLLSETSLHKSEDKHHVLYQFVRCAPASA